jgi:hypothetical protein
VIRSVDFSKLTKEEQIQIQRRLKAKIHAERHDTVQIIFAFLSFLRKTGNDQAMRGQGIDTPMAMSIRQKALDDER